MSEPYRDDNLLDRLSGAETRQVHYDQEMRRERLNREGEVQELDRMGVAAGDVRLPPCSPHVGVSAA